MRSASRGQTVVIGVFFMMLLLISLAVTMNLNRTSSQHQMGSQQRTKARQIAEEGVEYAIKILSVNETVWNNALQATPTWPAECNAVDPIQTPSGSRFSLQCSRANPELASYQVQVTVRGFSTQGTNNVALRAYSAFISRRTMGVSLTTGESASTALVMAQNPVTPDPNMLIVHWGPIFSLDKGENALAWALRDPMDRVTLSGPVTFNGYPRKFGQGGITGFGAAFGAANYRSPSWTSRSATTDGREYWAFASQPLPPVVDEDAYIAAARSAGNTGIPVPGGGGTVTTDCGTGPADCGKFNVTGGPAIFGTAGLTYTAPANRVIHVTGDAQVNRISMTNVSLFVTGNLELIDPAGTGDTAALRVPPTADKEYPDWPASHTTQWPCKANVVPGGGTCTVNDAMGPGQNVNFRGFICVLGNLTVSNSWNLAGTVVVGNIYKTIPTGQLILLPASQLRLFYDDVVNHQILTGRVELQVDRLREVSAT